MQKSLVAIAAVGLVLLGTGCLAPLPDGFVDLGSRGSTTLFVAADDTKLLVRKFQVPPEASVEFWTKAVRREFEERRGYRDPDVDLGEESAVLTYSANVGGLEYRYRLYLEELGRGRIRVAELVALADDFEEHAAAVDAEYRGD